MPYNKIEELEKTLTPKPGRAPASQMDTLFDLPNATKWDDPADVVSSPVAATPDRVVGGVDPDYSGYDDLENKIKALKPRDTSTADLISMGISTGIGAMFGRTGAAAKVAGQYGMDRFNKAEARADSVENMLLKLQQERAARMAKGVKGTKIKGTSGATDAAVYRYLGEDGYLHTPTRKKENGDWAHLESDPIFDKPNAQVRTIDTPDGGRVDILMDKNKGTSIGSKNAEAKMVKNAKGEMVPVNTHTILQNGGLPEDFNKTQMKLSPAAQAKYDDVSRRHASDGYLARYQTAASDLRAASAALGSDGELSPGFLFAAQRFLGMGMDKGRSLTNDEFAKVEGVNTGVIDAIKNKIIGYKQGKVSSDEVRQEYRKLTALLGTNVEQLRNERIGGYNNELKKGLNSEWRDDLAFGAAPGISAKQQSSDVKRVEKLSGELKSDKPVIKEFARPDGTIRRVKMVFDPAKKKYIYAGEAQ